MKSTYKRSYHQIKSRISFLVKFRADTYLIDFSQQDCDHFPGHSHGKMIDKYGYETAWNIVKLKQIAYRLQHIKTKLVPEFTRKLVAAYFCGVVRYSSSILWVRSSTYISGGRLKEPNSEGSYLNRPASPRFNNNRKASRGGGSFITVPEIRPHACAKKKNRNF